MNKFNHFFILVLLLLSFSSCDNDDDWVNDNYLYPEIEEWFNYLCSPELGGRYSGSEGIKKAKNYICNIIGESDSLTRISFPTDKCNMTNIIFHVDGDSDSLIVIGAHYDAYGYVNQTALPGADDNLSGVAVILQMIKTLQKNRLHPYYSLEFCFWDGEEIGRYGSQFYVSNLSKPIKYYINIDTCGNPYYGLGYGYSEYCLYLVDEFVDVQEKLSMKVEKYSPLNYTTDCEPFLNKKIPFISIGNDVLPYYLHTQGDNISIISFGRIDTISNVLYEHLANINNKFNF